jgi:hypothetical protein
MACALEEGVVAVAVARALAGEEEQGWPSPVSRKTPIRCERCVTRLRAAAAGV